MTSSNIVPATAGTGTAHVPHRVMAIKFKGLSAEERVQDLLPGEWGREDSPLYARHYVKTFAAEPPLWAFLVPSGADGYPVESVGGTLAGNVSLPRHGAEPSPLVAKLYEDLRRLPVLSLNQILDLRAAVNGQEAITFGHEEDEEEESKPPLWDWDGLIPSGTLAMLAAMPKAGKTTLLRQYLKAYDRGLPFFGRSTISSQPARDDGWQPRVLVLTEERRAEWKGKTPPWVSVESFRGNPPIASLKAWDTYCAGLRQRAMAYRLDLVVIDTIGRLVAFDENIPKQVAKVFEPLSRYPFATGPGSTTVLILHHISRTADGPVGSNARGSTALAGAVDACLELTQPYPDPDTRRKLAWVNRVGTHKGELVYRMAADGTLELADKAASLLAESAADIRGVRPAAGILDQLRGAR